MVAIICEGNTIRGIERITTRLQTATDSQNAVKVPIVSAMKDVSHE